MSKTTYMPQAYPLAVAWWNHLGDWRLPDGPDAEAWLTEKITDEFSALVTGWQITETDDPNEPPVLTVPVSPDGPLSGVPRCQVVYASTLTEAITSLARNLAARSAREVRRGKKTEEATS
ncbi:hypothetical protein ML5_1402 [Micromonospora sp. L5]|uniref:hypothetical protein n=1 Tax=Micromonospora sp. (strain L5) TaxID=648999 RepID=UPI0001C46A35|nr:hypothetical protein [Micromonospora sp. L5]ADU06940.1 hypothetical protein ML5_1402 [Micromonospora sp. L5]